MAVLSHEKGIHFRKLIKEPFVLKVIKQLSEKKKISTHKIIHQLIIAGCKAYANDNMKDEFVVIKKSSIKLLDQAIKDAAEEISKQ